MANRAWRRDRRNACIFSPPKMRAKIHVDAKQTHTITASHKHIITQIQTTLPQFRHNYPNCPEIWPMDSQLHTHTGACLSLCIKTNTHINTYVNHIDVTIDIRMNSHHECKYASMCIVLHGCMFVCLYVHMQCAVHSHSNTRIHILRPSAPAVSPTSHHTTPDKQNNTIPNTYEHAHAYTSTDQHTTAQISTQMPRSTHNCTDQHTPCRLSVPVAGVFEGGAKT